MYVCVCVCVLCVCVCAYVFIVLMVSDVLINLIFSENLKCPMDRRELALECVLQVTPLGGLSAPVPHPPPHHFQFCHVQQLYMSKNSAKCCVIYILVTATMM